MILSSERSRRLDALLKRHLPVARGPGLRAWVLEARDGEAAYWTAIRLMRALGRRDRSGTLRVFASEWRQQELDYARMGLYPLKKALRVCDGKLDGFFRREGRECLATKGLRECLVFAPQEHRDVPFLRLNLIVCPQALVPPKGWPRQFSAMHFALAPGGLLFFRPSVKVPEALFERVAPDLPLFAKRHAPEADAEYLRACGLMPGGATAQAARAAELESLNRELRAAKEDLETINGRLTASEERYRHLFDKAGDAIFVIDPASDRIIDANEAGRRLYGYPQEEFLRLRGDQLAAPRPRRPEGGERRKGLRSSAAYHRRKDGSVFPVEIVAGHFTAGGKRLDLILVRDMTARMHAEVAESYRSRQAVQDHIIATVSHELRTPVALIKGFAETLHAGVESAKERREFTETILRHSERLARLVEGLLGLTALDSGKRRRRAVPVPLGRLLREACLAQDDRAKAKAVKVSLSCPASLSALGDPAELPHVFENLIDNAVKFSHQGGRVSVAARGRGKEVLITVADRGLGIPEADLERIFERFYRSERGKERPGAGLGLAIARSLVESNGGRITVRSGSGGSKFSVVLARAI